jgi:starch-binding outer membrane protein, SusD/RagB family
MKRIYFSILLMVSLGASSCSEKFLDLDPLDLATTEVYFKTPAHFKAASNDFYNKMISWRKVDDSNIFDFMDYGSDLTLAVNSYGQGGITVPSTDVYWRNPYKYIRAANVIIEKASEYTGDQNGIKQYVAAAYFFRAWQHFFLLKRFGGVPIVTRVLSTDSEELDVPRNSRYEVMKQVLADLDVAIEGLPTEQNIAAGDKGQVSKWAAMAFKARVLLYEGTWEKYVGETTDFAEKQKQEDNSAKYFTEAASLAKTVIEQGGYELWNGAGDRSYYYLFVLEDALSNPAGLTKTSNKEFILKSNYDYTYYRSALNISHTVASLGPNRKMMDMYLCTDGLPPSHSSVFAGYTKKDDEYKNRDKRLLSIAYIPGQKYWGRGASIAGGGAYYDGRAYPASIVAVNPILNGGFGYGNRKFLTEHRLREDNQESYDYPQIRLAEVYLIYAEALFEKDGAISDADLNLSINKLRQRAGVAPLTNALIAANSGLTMLGEIRRERALELYGEGFRFDDLKRWGIAEQELNQQVLGIKVVGTDYQTVSGNYDPSKYSFGIDAATGALIVDPAVNRKFSRKNYLFPLPAAQILLNNNLVQNPGY